MKAHPSLFLTLALIISPFANADVVSDLTAKAEGGDAVAQMELGSRHTKGEGVAKDMAKGIEWLTKAAEQGNGEAQMTLGSLYIGGKGVRKSSADAAKWFQMSAETGNPAAQLQIGRMHMAGAGVIKDDVEAYKWANLAAGQGDMAAKKVVSFLTGKMTPEQVSSGQAKSQEFLDLKKSREVLGDPPADPVEPAPPLEAEPATE